MAQKQVKDKSTNKKRRNIALAVCIPVAAAGVAAAITLPLIQCHYQHKEVIPYEALNIAEGEQSRLPDYPTCNILYGFKPE
ncbi:MAG: hypothetical protein MJ200_03785 [Mycoplasmoidaceae bacterium]|nr:hypothetical protein [Mycoplasmoidaceae bacterium]